MTAVATTYRTCPRSGLQFERQAEMLIKAHAFVGVVWLLIGGLLAIGVVLTRWPAVRWLEADTFYMVLTAHGLDMLIFWIIFFEIAILHFCSSTLLRCRIATPKIAWLGFALMLIGSILNNVAVFRGGSSVMMTSYVPMMAEPSFYLGIMDKVSLQLASTGNPSLTLPGHAAEGNVTIGQDITHANVALNLDPLGCLYRKAVQYIPLDVKVAVIDNVANLEVHIALDDIDVLNGKFFAVPVKIGWQCEHVFTCISMTVERV